MNFLHFLFIMFLCPFKTILTFSKSPALVLRSFFSFNRISMKEFEKRVLIRVRLKQIKTEIESTLLDGLEVESQTLELDFTFYFDKLEALKTSYLNFKKQLDFLENSDLIEIL